MSLRARIAAALRTAEAAEEAQTAATLRLVMTTIRDRDLARRAGQEEDSTAPREGPAAAMIDDAAVRAILSKLAAQRRETAATLEAEGRLAQAADKTAEAETIESFLPRRMDAAEIDSCIDRTVSDLDARCLRDLGRVMAALRPRLDGHLPPEDLRARVRARLEM